MVLRMQGFCPAGGGWEVGGEAAGRHIDFGLGGRQLSPKDQAAQASHPGKSASLDIKGFPKFRAICLGVVSWASTVR